MECSIDMGKPRRKDEYYYKTAKKLGYRARSAFKLKQMEKKYRRKHIGKVFTTYQGYE